MVSNHLFYRFYRSARPLGRTEGTCFPVFYQIAMALCAVVNMALWPAIGSRLRTCPPRFAGYTKWVWSQLSTKSMAFCGKWAPQARRVWNRMFQACTYIEQGKVGPCQRVLQVVQVQWSTIPSALHVVNVELVERHPLRLALKLVVKHLM